MKLFSTLLLSLFFASSVWAGEINLKITKRYLNLPVSQKVDRKSMSFLIDGNIDRTFVIRLSADPEYWVFTDVSSYKNKTLKIVYDGDSEGLSKIYQDDKPADSDSFYREENRPQLHFTTKRGWINDPNGLIYYDGEYHLFYQHNPYEREWENMHWGHAVSRDLVHWNELSDALYPDRLGTMFSGTTVIDYENTSGFGTKKNPVMVAIYTAHNSEREVQCLAYSLDKGRTWAKFAGNPVINSKEKWKSSDTRDPKVFWHKPINKWVMVLNERDGHSIYNSENLKDWTFESHIVGFWECPELFELPIDGDKNNTLWVMYGASGTYMLGHFDGKKFTPVTGKLACGFGSIYAAQTFNNIPKEDGRRIQIGWENIKHSEMPFRGQMGFPTELSLRSTKDGVRLFNNPIKELDALQGNALIRENGISAQKANELLDNYKNEATLRIKTTIGFTQTTSLGLSLFGQNIIDYDLNFNRISGFFYSQQDFSLREISADVIIDKTSIQVYFDGGAISYSFQREPHQNNNDGFRFWSSHPIEIKKLEVFPMKSIWR